MSLDNVTPGSKVPEAFNVIIEIPMNADPVKYEVDKATGAIFVDRFMSTAMHYPTNYGYVPKTLSGDGDPVDVLVITPVPLIPGVVVPCRAIGILKMQDEAGEDGKLTTVGKLGDKAAIGKTYKKSDWNDYVIIAKGNHIQHFLNGVQTVDIVDKDPKNSAARGILALQIHAGPPMLVEFKNVRLKELK